MSGLHPNEPIIDELVAAFRTKWSGAWSEFRMAEELIGLAMELDRLEAENKVLRGEWPCSFHRQNRRL